MSSSGSIFKNARFEATSSSEIVSVVGTCIGCLVFGTVLPLFAGSSFIGLGKFIQALGAFSILLFILHIKQYSAQSGTFAGECPYCGTPTLPNFPLRVESPYVSTGMDCHKCHNRILLKNRKFYRLDPPNHLDRRFTGTKEGIGLVRTGIVVSCFLPIAFVIGIFSGIFTFSLLGFFTPIVLCLGISLAMQLRGVWFCLQTPDCNLGRQWIVATAWLQGISLVLIVLQAILREASWLNLPIGGVIFAGQLTFLTYLVMLATFLKRPDLASNFRELRLDSIIIFVGTSAINLGLPFLRDYEIQLLILLGLQGAACLRRYLRELKLLKWHLDKITTGQSA